MRLLVLDASRVLVAVVKRVAPSCVQVETVDRFDAAWELLRERTPAAVIANLTPGDLPWDALRDYCQSRRPPIPVLFESCIYSTPGEAGLGPLGESAAFLQKPYSLEELKTQIDRLVRTALETRVEADPCASDEELAIGDGDLPTTGPRLGG